VRTGAKNGVVTQKVIEEAAAYAAFYSSHRTSTNVIVDFTRVKHVRKIPKSKPGMVSYTNHKSIVVKPQEASSQS
jgi:predicted ribosome quality control (RQC) complex YloA/Tae2 family protein